MKKDKFPSKEEFYQTILKFKREKATKREGEYLGYLKEQRMRKKPRKVKYGENEYRRKYYKYSENDI